MIKMQPNQWVTLLLIVAFGVSFLTAVAVVFITRNYYERKRKRPTPFIESVINRYASVMFDERYAKLTDRELIKMLRDTIWIALWLAHEASLRLAKKVERAERLEAEKK